MLARAFEAPPTQPAHISRGSGLIDEHQLVRLETHARLADLKPLPARLSNVGPFLLLETPEFQRQSRDVAAAAAALGKPVKIIEGMHIFHDEMAESLANPYGTNGRAALEMIGLASA